MIIGEKAGRGKPVRKILNLGGQSLEYELERKKVKNINLRIDRQGNVFVSAPRLAAQATIERFLLTNAGRILEIREKLLRNAEQVSDREDSFVLLGRRMEIVIRQGARSDAVLEEGIILLTLRDVNDREEREKALKTLLRQVAEERVRECCRRTYPRFQAMGVGEPEISFRSMKRSWGNCRPREGCLCFNTALARVPETCVEYVVCHEFCHFIHPDHSPRFHALMGMLMPDWKVRKKILEKYASLM